MTNAKNAICNGSSTGAKGTTACKAGTSPAVPRQTRVSVRAPPALLRAVGARAQFFILQASQSGFTSKISFYRHRKVFFKPTACAEIVLRGPQSGFPAQDSFCADPRIILRLRACAKTDSPPKLFKL